MDKICHSSLYYPEANGQVETSKKLVLNLPKTKLRYSEGKWVEELLDVLWEIQNSLINTTNETLFFLFYGMEAVIPTKIITPVQPEMIGGSNNNSKRSLDFDNCILCTYFHLFY